MVALSKNVCNHQDHDSIRSNYSPTSDLEITDECNSNLMNVEERDNSISGNFILKIQI